MSASPGSARPDPVVHDELVDRLVQSAFVITAVLTRLGGDNELSLTQLRVLGILRDSRRSVTDLAHHLGLEKSTMSGLVARAEKRGLVARTANSADGRGVVVLITATGTVLIDELYARAERELAPLTGRLGGSEQQRLIVLLRRLLGV